LTLAVFHSNKYNSLITSNNKYSTQLILIIRD